MEKFCSNLCVCARRYITLGLCNQLKCEYRPKLLSYKHPEHRSATQSEGSRVQFKRHKAHYDVYIYAKAFNPLKYWRF